jgi:hypothetical protein
MKYKVGDKIRIKEKDSYYSKEFIIFLKRHDYKLTISHCDSTRSDEKFLGNEKYLAKEMQEDSYFKDSYVWGRYIEELYIEELCLEVKLEPIRTRFEILDL